MYKRQPEDLAAGDAYQQDAPEAAEAEHHEVQFDDGDDVPETLLSSHGVAQDMSDAERESVH